jgi:hypothetical protein
MSQWTETLLTESRPVSNACSGVNFRPSRLLKNSRILALTSLSPGLEVSDDQLS